MREPYTDDADDDCGSTRGYYRHRAEGTETCQDCRDAWTAYNRGRARSPESVEREKKAHAARERARVRLAREYPDRYRELVRVANERCRDELREWGSAGPGRVRQHPSNAPAATLPIYPEGASGLMVPCPRPVPHPRNAERFRATRNGGVR